MCVAGHLQSIATPGPKFVHTLCERVRTSILQSNSELRATQADVFAEIASACPPVGRGLMIGTFPPPAARSDAQLEVLTGFNAIQDGQAAIDLEALRLPTVVPVADLEARKIGMLIDWNAPEAWSILLLCLHAHRDARTAMTRINAGHSVPFVDPFKPRQPPRWSPLHPRRPFGGVRPLSAFKAPQTGF